MRDSDIDALSADGAQEPTFILNQNEGADTIHRAFGLTERCNTDQIEGRKTVDEMTAEAMVLRGDAVACRHCQPKL